MNKKAFTLIEMIAAVIIISILAIIVVVTVNNVMTKSEDKKYKEFKRELEQAACTYIDLNVNKAFKDTCYSSGVCTITSGMLIKDGVISEKLVDPRTDTAVSKSLNITVVWTTDSATNARKKTCSLQNG